MPYFRKTVESALTDFILLKTLNSASTENTGMPLSADDGTRHLRSISSAFEFGKKLDLI
jgi:hypothetical protein